MSNPSEITHEDKKKLVNFYMHISGTTYDLMEISETAELHKRVDELLADFNQFVLFVRGIPK